MIAIGNQRSDNVFYLAPAGCFVIVNLVGILDPPVSPMAAEMVPKIFFHTSPTTASYPSLYWLEFSGREQCPKILA